MSTPLAAHFRLSLSLSPKSYKENKHMPGSSYSSVVKSIIYVIICTYPDISYVVSVVRRFMGNPSKVN